MSVGSAGSRCDPVWVPRVLADAMHRAIIAATGGLQGIRDGGLVDSALDRPKNRWAHDDASDLADLGAAYCVGLANNHGYIDGNKRTAFLVTYAFLRANGLRLITSEPEAVVLMIDVATRVVSETALAAWIRAHTQRV